MRHPELLVTVLVLVAMAVCSHDEVAAVSPPALGDPPPAGTRVMSDNPLASLSALPKAHHSTDMAVGDRLNATDPVLLDYARITHSLGISVAGASKQLLLDAVAACHAADALPAVHPLPNATAIRCGIAANYNPWGEDASPFPRAAPPTLQGPLEAAELQMYRERLGNVSVWLADANAELNVSPPVALSIVLLDSERFATQEMWSTPNSEWNRAITRKHDLFLNLTAELLPSVPVEFCDFGGAGRSDYGYSSGWSTEEYFTLQENTSAYAVSLYTVQEIGYTREAYDRTVALATAHNASTVTPWVSLGCGYRRGFDVMESTYDFLWNYDYIYSWQLGSEINNDWYGERPEQFAHWLHAGHVVFYPSIFDCRMANVSTSGHAGGPVSPWPAGVHHFVAYVMGATCHSCAVFGCVCRNWGDPTLPPIQNSPTNDEER